MSHPRLLEGAINAFADQLEAAAYDRFMDFSYETLLDLAKERWVGVPFTAEEQDRKPELVLWIMEESLKG